VKREAFHEMFSAEDQHWWFVARRTIMAKILRSFSPGKVGTILEIGCGTGGNLAMLSRFGAVCGMELDDEARALAESRKICPVQKGSLPDAIPRGQNFDLICLLDVLEHITDDLGALKAVGNKLAPGGKFLLTVPAYKFMWSAHDVELGHKRRYRRRELSALCQQAGFTVRYSTYFNTFLFPVIAGTRLVGRLGGGGGGTDVAMPPEMLNRLLAKIFAVERFLLPAISLPFGVSLLVVAENAPVADIRRVIAPGEEAEAIKE